MNYFPDFMSLFGMIFYSFIVYLFVGLFSIMRHKIVERYVSKQERRDIERSKLKSSKKKK
jgi:hypothetical protein